MHHVHQRDLVSTSGRSASPRSSVTVTATAPISRAGAGDAGSPAVTSATANRNTTARRLRCRRRAAAPPTPREPPSSTRRSTQLGMPGPSSTPTAIGGLPDAGRERRPGAVPRPPRCRPPRTPRARPGRAARPAGCRAPSRSPSRPRHPTAVSRSGRSGRGSTSTASTRLPRRAACTRLLDDRVVQERRQHHDQRAVRHLLGPQHRMRCPAGGAACTPAAGGAATAGAGVRRRTAGPAAAGRGRRGRPGRPGADSWRPARWRRARPCPACRRGRTNAPDSAQRPRGHVGAHVEPGVQGQHDVGVGLGVPFAHVQRVQHVAAGRGAGPQRRPPVDAAQPVPGW